MDIKAERERAGLSQAQLAALAGIASSNLSALESGKRPLSARMASRLLRQLRRPSQALADHRGAALAMISQFGATNPRVFGSVAKGTDTPRSDLDILVTVCPENAWRFLGLQQALSDLLGVEVDVVSDNGLSEKHRQILAEAIPL